MIRKTLSILTGKTYKHKYRIDEKLFSGAFSEIYKAKERTTGNTVVIKILTEAGKKIARLLKEDMHSQWEGEILMNMNHPNIVKGFDFDSGRYFWIAMEYLEYPLNLHITRNMGKMKETEKIDILIPIARAINYIHQQGLVHRDIATDNVMLKGKTAKLIDFGMTVPIGSKVIKGRVGTPSYMAPETIKNREYTPAGDIYSFGMVMYELVTGTKPFAAESKEQRMTKALNLKPVSPSGLGKTCSRGLERLIMGCISKNPYQRPENAHEIVQLLDDIKQLKKK